MQPKKILGDRIFVVPVDPNESSTLITPDTVDDFPDWYKITRLGEDVSDEYSVGDIVLMSSEVVKRQGANGLEFEFTDGRKEFMMKETNILGIADSD